MSAAASTGPVPATRVWCRAGVVRLGGSRDGCQWAGYRNLASATAKPCPRCGSEVVHV